MSRSLSPDLVWDRIRAVIETRHCLSERERRALRVRKVWRFGPRGYGEQTLVGFPSLFGVLDAAVYARAATINLTRSEVHQVKNFWGAPDFWAEPISAWMACIAPGTMAAGFLMRACMGSSCHIGSTSSVIAMTVQTVEM